MKIELDTPTPRYLFADMLTDGTYTTEILGTHTATSKDGKELLFLHIRFLNVDSGYLEEYYLSKWRAKSMKEGFALEIGQKYQMRKEGINFIFS